MFYYVYGKLRLMIKKGGKNMSKKIGIILAIIIIVAIIIGAVIFLKPQPVKNVEGSLEDIMAKLYNGIPQDQLPMMLGNIELNSENIEYYVGTNDIDFKEAMASESGVGSIAHSVVLIRLNDARKAEETVNKIKETADPVKWICVQAENVVVENKGDLVVLIMSDAKSEQIKTNFEGLE